MGGRRDGQTTLGRVYRKYRTSLNLRVLRMGTYVLFGRAYPNAILTSTKSNQFLVHTKESWEMGPPLPLSVLGDFGSSKITSSGLQSSSTLGKLLSFWDLGLFPCEVGFIVLPLSKGGCGD